MLKYILLVGIGGFLGSVMRYLTQIVVEKYFDFTFPYGTFLANVLGCFLIGLVYAISEKGTLMGPGWRIFLTVGLCGGFTTFSSFAYQNLYLIKSNTIWYMLINIGASVFFGILAVYLGIILIRFTLPN
jgi:CrcB protein